MKIAFFRISFAFVLVGNVSSFSDAPFGSCTAKELWCRSRKCLTAFLKAFQKDPKADCSALVSKGRNCIVDAMNFCMKDQLNESFFINISDTTMKKEDCDEVFLDVLNISPWDLFCSTPVDVNICVECFRRKVIKDKSDPALCSEYAETKRCLRDLSDSNCNRPPESNKNPPLFPYDVYNPLCADNRDPGATENDICDGVLDDSAAAGTAGTHVGVYNPFCAESQNGQCHGVSKTAGTKLGGFLTLMFAFFPFLFLFKA